MIDIAGIRYRAVLIKTTEQYEIQNSLEELTWEENERELSVRIMFSVKNTAVQNKMLSELIELGDQIRIYASDGTAEQEVARGRLVEWKAISSSNSEQFQGICYDELYQLQQSQENYYFSAGRSTSSLIKEILKDWSLPLKIYQGPEAIHGKLVYKALDISSILSEILEEAKKKTGKRALLRAEQGQAVILEYGSNPVVYRFEEENIRMVSQKQSTSDMVTRVKVVGQETKEGKFPVEATLNGLIGYGIRQQIYFLNFAEDLKDAKAAAQEILNTRGTIQKELSVESPDLPFLRKGDRIWLHVGALQGEFYVLSVQHDAGSVTMSLQVEQAEAWNVSENKAQTKRQEWKPGDIVNFTGGMHYVSSNSGAGGYSAKAGEAKVTAVKPGSAHPWHIIHTDRTSNVYGWVDKNTIQNVENG